MRGIVLAGGTGSRLYPLTKVTNKHLLPIGNKPMIYYPVEKIVEAGIQEILIITGIEHMGDVVSLLGSGKEFNCSFTYRVQDEAGGIAQAMGLAESFCGNDPLLVILGDNIFSFNLRESALSFQKQQNGAKLFLKTVPDPERFGVPVFKKDQLIKIEEKPDHPQSNYAVTGIYMYDSTVFEYVKQCSPSKRGELEISDVNNFYINQNNCAYDILDGYWTDAGTFSSLKRATDLVS